MVTKNHSLAQVVHDRVKGVMQQIGAIKHGNDLHAGGRNAVVQFFHFLMDCFQRGPRVRALAHQDDTLNDVGHSSTMLPSSIRFARAMLPQAGF